MTAFQSLFGERIDFQSYNYYYYVHRKLIKQILSEVWLLIPHTIKVSRLYQTEWAFITEKIMNKPTMPSSKWFAASFYVC